MGLKDVMRGLFSPGGAQRDVRPTSVIATSAREAAVVALEAGNWRGASVAASKLVSDGGAATTPEPWLVYAASAVLHGRMVNAVSSIDVALRTWVQDPSDRAVLLWARGALAQHQLLDPRTALVDYDAAREHAPAWLADLLAADRKRCAGRARAARKLPAEIAAAPDYDPLARHDRAASPLPGLVPGTRPAVWGGVVAVLTRPAEGERGPQCAHQGDLVED